MRAPCQIMAIPYRRNGKELEYCVLHRADFDQWQFVSGGAEDAETPREAAIREIREEAGVDAHELLALTSMCHIPACCYPPERRVGWSKDTYVVPEYAFAFECRSGLTLSDEHDNALWLGYEDAHARLWWDSNRTALYELDCVLNGRLRQKERAK